LVENYGFKHEDVERIYNGCDTNRLVGNGVDNKYMLFVGRHVHYKNIRTLIDLAKETGYKLICVGDGLDKSNLEIYAKKVEACVEFKGNVPFDEMVKLYQECSFYVTASKWEGFGLPVIEAGACEKPALVPNNTAHPELIEDGKTGFIYDDYGELARFAKRLIQDQELRRSMGLQGRKRVESKFSLDRTARKYIELYKELVLN
jgi:glycosyltransferase involved in cell wall biosynthesis